MNLVMHGSELTDLDAFHRLLAAHEAVPDWYGRNLDAAWDLLTCLVDGWTIELVEPRLAAQNLGADWAVLLGLLVDAVAETPGARLLLTSLPERPFDQQR
jgi:ribonuclease inhibitor